MWIFDLLCAVGCLGFIGVPGYFIARQYQKLKHPAPTLQEQIQYLENLNTELDKQQEVEWERQLGQ